MTRATRIVEKLLDDELFEMANVLPADSGLRHRVWVSVNMHQWHNRPRLKVEGTNKQFYPASIDDPVEMLEGWPPGFSAADFHDLQQFIALNRDLLLDYWNDRIGTKAMSAAIRAV